MSPRRIAVLDSIADMGGAQISLLELVRRLAGHPHVTLIVPQDGPLRQRALDAGAEVRILPWPEPLARAGERAGGLSIGNLGRAGIAAWTVPAYALRLARTLDEIGADVLVTNSIKPHIIGAIASLHSRRPLVWYLRDGLEGRPMSRLALRALGWRCQGAIAISRYIEQESRGVLPASVPVKVIYNLVDFGRFHSEAPPPDDLRKESGEVWFGVVGALTPLKGQDVFLRAAAQVAAELPRARFFLVGTNFYSTERGGSFGSELRRLAEVPSLAGRVSFLGHRDDIPSVLRLLDVLVQPNRAAEALGRSVLEAMACGVPVIASDRWGPAELIAHGETGLLTPVLDVPALASCMLQLGREPSQRAALAYAAAEWVRNELEPDRIVRQFREFVERAAR